MKGPESEVHYESKEETRGGKPKVWCGWETNKVHSTTISNQVTCQVCIKKAGIVKIPWIC